MRPPASLAAIEAHLRARCRRPLPGAEAQRRFAPDPPLPGWAPDLDPPTARRAAALVLLYPTPDGVALPLTVRRDDLPHHPGQVSLPGGAVGVEESPADAACREAHEEIGVPAAEVRLIGPLSPLWVAVSNFVVQPFVGVADVRPAFQPHPAEVAHLLEVPLDDVLDAARLRRGRRARDGVDVEFPYFDLAGHVVWGATAMILGEFTQLFRADPEQS